MLDIPAHERLIIDMDDGSIENIKALCERLKDKFYGPKFESLLAQCGAEIADKVGGARVFLDYKIHTIPSKAANIIYRLAWLRNVGFVTLHCSGGLKMLKEAKEARDQFCPHTKLLGVTIPTSLAPQEIGRIYNIDPTPENIVKKVVGFAKMAAEAGLDGVVCSGQELPELMDHPRTRDLIKVAVGIREQGEPTQDQSRVSTINQASRWGGDYFVIGRPITKAKNPVATSEEFVRQIQLGFAVGIA